MKQLNEQQIDYLMKFVVDLHQKVPHTGSNDIESFIDDIKIKRVGSYTFYPLADGKIRGNIFVHDDIANIDLELMTLTTIDSEEAGHYHLALIDSNGLFP